MECINPRKEINCCHWDSWRVRFGSDWSYSRYTDQQNFIFFAQLPRSYNRPPDPKGII